MTLKKNEYDHVYWSIQVRESVVDNWYMEGILTKLVCEMAIDNKDENAI